MPRGLLDQRPGRVYADILPLSSPAATELDYQPGMELRLDPAAGLLGEILRGARTISSGVRGNPVTPREATEAMLAVTGGSALATRPAGALASGLGRRVRPEDALIAHHNTTPEGLLAIDELGGVPMPSIAISKAGDPMQGYGDISLLFRPDQVAPSRDMRVYGADIYSGRQPRPKIEIADPEKAATQLMKDPNFAHFSKEDVTIQFQLANDPFYGRDYDYLNGRIQIIQQLVEDGVIDTKKYRNMHDLFESVRTLPDVYKGPEATSYFYKRASTKPGISEVDVIKKLPPVGDPYTPMGNRRKEIPYTLENALRHMRADKAFEPGTENFGMSPGIARGLSAERFRSLAGIKKARDRIVGPDRSDYKDDWAEKYFNVAERIAAADREVLNVRRGEGFIDAVARGEPLGQFGDLNTPENRELAIGLLRDARSLPTGYFEAKPRRAINPQEFAGAIIPGDASDSVVGVLRKYNIPTARGAIGQGPVIYDNFDDLLFSSGSILPGLLAAQSDPPPGKNLTPVY